MKSNFLIILFTKHRGLVPLPTSSEGALPQRPSRPNPPPSLPARNGIEAVVHGQSDKGGVMDWKGGPAIPRMSSLTLILFWVPIYNAETDNPGQGLHCLLFLLELKAFTHI